MAISASNETDDSYPQSEMAPTWIVEAVDVSAKSQFSGGAGLEDSPPNQLVLDRL